MGSSFALLCMGKGNAETSGLRHFYKLDEFFSDPLRSGCIEREADGCVCHVRMMVDRRSSSAGIDTGTKSARIAFDSKPIETIHLGSGELAIERMIESQLRIGIVKDNDSLDPSERILDQVYQTELRVALRYIFAENFGWILSILDLQHESSVLGTTNGRSHPLRIGPQTNGDAFIRCFRLVHESLPFASMMNGRYRYRHSMFLRSGE